MKLAKIENYGIFYKILYFKIKYKLPYLKWNYNYVMTEFFN